MNKNGTLKEHTATESALKEQIGGSYYKQQEKRITKQMKNDMTRLFIMPN